MSSAFVPVDLDQVLDEFEEQELRNGTTETLPHSTFNSIPSCNMVATKLQTVETESSRTYSFNAPLDSLLTEPTADNSGSGMSLAEELADANIKIENEDNLSECGSETNSISAVIAAAEAITNTKSSQADSVQQESSFERKDTLLDYFDNLEVQDGNILVNKNDYDDVNKPPVRTQKADFLNTTSSSDTKQEDVDMTTSVSSVHSDNTLETHEINQNNEHVTSSNNTISVETHEDSFDNKPVPHTGTSQENAVVSGECTKEERSASTVSYEDNKICNIINHNNSTTLLDDEAGLPDQTQDICTSMVSSLGTSSMSSTAEIGNLLDTEIGHGKQEGPSGAEECSPADSEHATEYRTIVPAQSETHAAVGTETHAAVGTDLLFNPEHYSGLMEGSVSPHSHDSSAESLCVAAPNVAGQENLSNTPQEDLPLVPSPAPSLESSPNPQEINSTAVHISSGDPEMGFVPPVWVPDDVATHCMNCGLKFTIIKRKHHCRACGKVLCSSCCNMKYALPYLGNKEARVCQVCCDVLLRVDHQLPGEPSNVEPSYASTWQTTPYINEEGQPVGEAEREETSTEAVAETASEADNMEALTAAEEDADVSALPSTAEATAPPPITTPPAPGVENEGADDISQDATPEPASSPPLSTSPQPISLDDAITDSTTSITTPISPAPSDDSDFAFRLDVEQVRALIPKDPMALPPVLNIRHKVISIQENADPAEIMYRLKGLGECVVFMLNKNLIVKVKIVKLSCCVKKKCWCFVTDGMGAASQEEMVVLLECEHHENTIPKDVLSHFNTAFAYAKQGHVVSDLGFTIFGQPFLGSPNNAGFLYIKPTFQCLENLPVPLVPFVVGILIQRLEAPWAQLFPLRLMLRLGTEFRYYPCPLWSVRNRPSVYGDIGHTIMNLLTDFKNFQYSVPRVTGLVIHMESTITTIRLPQDRYDEILKVLNAAEEHMFALGANFSKEADSHLVCIQEGEMYKTQAINIQNKPRKVTGASFVVFTGSLKSVTPHSAKVSILEDGLMVQMMPDAILELRKALREMQEYTIDITSAASNAVQSVKLEWASRETTTETHVSPIDGTILTDTPTIRVHSSCDFTRREIYRIRWTHVFLKRNTDSTSRGVSSRGLSHLTGELARACCEALRAHLPGLHKVGLTCLALRVNIDSDSAEYAIGANQNPLPAEIMTDLDNALVPAMNAAAMRYGGSPLTVELFFNIIILF